VGNHLDGVTYDFDLLLDGLRYHKLIPMDPNSFDLDFEPNQISTWKKLKLESASESLRLADEMRTAYNQLINNDIDCIVLKGPILAMSLFGDLGSRQYGDIDLLVKREDLSRAVRSLKQIGYAPVYKIPTNEKYYFRYKKDLLLKKAGWNLFVELHVGIYRTRLLKREFENELLMDITYYSIGGTHVKTLDKNNTLLYLLYHGGQHLYFKLFWLRDVAEAVETWQLNHEIILHKAQRLGIVRMVGLGLLLANEIFGIIIPEEYSESIEDDFRRLSKLKKICLKRIMRTERDTIVMKMQRLYFNLLLKAGIRYKWAVITSIFHRWYIRKFLMQG
jgi:hypothetical protein